MYNDVDINYEQNPTNAPKLSYHFSRSKPQTTKKQRKERKRAMVGRKANVKRIIRAKRK